MSRIVRVKRTLAYGLAILIEAPYDLVKILSTLADFLPEKMASYTSGRAWVHRENSVLGYLLKGLFNAFLMPVQWILGAVYQITGLRLFTNWLREATDRKMLSVITKNDSNEMDKKGELLSFLQKQRRKNNSGRGVYTFDEGNSNSHDDGSQRLSHGICCIERRYNIDKCIDELLTPLDPNKLQTSHTSLYAQLLSYLKTRLVRVNKKLDKISQPDLSSAVARKTHIDTNTSYRQHPTNIFFFKKAESAAERRLRLEGNKQSLIRMQASMGLIKSTI